MTRIYRLPCRVFVVPMLAVYAALLVWLLLFAPEVG